MPTQPTDIVSLSRYFSYVVLLREMFSSAADIDELTRTESTVTGLLNSRAGAFLLFSYSALHVVVEGWQELKLKDPKLDDLVASPFVSRLRRFRNATYHYQRELLSPKHLQFFGDEQDQTEVWIGQLYDEFERYFSERLQPVPEKLEELLQGKQGREAEQTIRDYFAKLSSGPSTAP